jgi:hypothetical protein
MLKSVPLVLAGILLLAPAAISARTPQAAPAAPSASAAPPAAHAVPAEMKNPVKPTAASQAHAKQIYSFDGKGKTDLATSMALTLPDFSQAASLSSQHDGELFNLIRNGKDKMPGEDAGRANNDVVWNLVLYVRSFAKQSLAAGAPQESPAAK